MLDRARRWLRKNNANEAAALLVACGIFLSGWAFIEIADEVSEGEHEEVENTILRSFRDPANPEDLHGPLWVNEFARDLTALGGTAVLTMLTLLVLAYLLISGRQRHALLVLVAVAGGVTLSTLLKISFGRERPDIVPHLMTIFDPSFPSGHAMLSSVVYLTLGTLLAQSSRRRRERIFFINAALLLTFLVGLSRMALGVHYPSDVMAGWAAGTAWALLCWTAAWWLKSRRAAFAAEEGATAGS